MVNLPREGLSLLLKLKRAFESADTTEAREEVEIEDSSTTVDPEAEPMKAYWESDIENLYKSKTKFIDLFQKDVALNRIPGETEKPIQESHYSFHELSLVYMPDVQKNLNFDGNVSYYYYALILHFQNVIYFGY